MIRRGEYCMKPITSTLLVLGTWTATTSSGYILLDQIGPDDGSMIGTGITGCQDFEAAYDFYDIATLDNFTGNGETIHTVEMVLVGWNGFVDPSSVHGYTANLYSDPAAAALDLMGDVGSSYSDAADATQSPTWAGAGFVISMPAQMFTPSGTNWIAMVPSNDFATGGQTGVADTLMGDGTLGWQANPGGGFGMPGNMQEMTGEAAYRLISTPCDSSLDCNKNGIADCDDLADGTSEDCNGNDIPDECDIAKGTSQDIDGNGVPDECQDCNENGIADYLDIQNGTSYDCDQNYVPDECQPDCDGDGWIDACDNDADVDGDGIPDNCEDDCNGNTLPDHWEIEMGWVEDCNDNLIPDECDIADGTAEDCNDNGILDECEMFDDCNDNLIPDECDIASGWSNDVDGNGIPDECKSDCNANGVPDYWDLKSGTSEDCNDNLIPDECELGSGTSATGTVTITDLTNINNGDKVTLIATDATSHDFTAGDVAGGGTWIAEIDNDTTATNLATQIDANAKFSASADGAIVTITQAVGGVDGNTTITLEDSGIDGMTKTDFTGGTDEDCNDNLIPDECDIESGLSWDLNSNGVPDECEPDCNDNGTVDEWDIATGLSEDINGDGMPDECQCLADITGDNMVDVNDLLAVIGYWGSSIQAGDVNYDGIVDVTDLLIVVGNWGPCE